MIGRRLEAGDIKVEIEKERTWNVAPLILPDEEVIGHVHGNLANGTNWIVGGSDWMRVRPNWQADASPDAWGNRRWFLDSRSMGKKTYALESVSATEGVPGKYYSMSIDVRTYVTAMNGNFDYIPQPPARFKLYATNGIEAQDVQIAESSVINPILPSNNTWPFHPGFREWKLDVLPTVPMPAGKTYFRLKLEYDNDWVANKEIYLPASFSYPTAPDNLNMFAVRFDSQTIYEHSGMEQPWFSVGGGTTGVRYEWLANRMYRTTDTRGVGFHETLNVVESGLTTHGAFVSLFLGWAEPNLYLRVHTHGYEGNPANVYTSPTTNVAAGRHTFFVPASYFKPDGDGNASVVLYVNARGIQTPLIRAAGEWDDTDTYYFWRYRDWADWTTSIDVQRYDTEVSTCTVALRERPGVEIEGQAAQLDTGDYFEQGKRVRISAPNVYPGQTARSYYSQAYNYYNTVFTGEILKRTAKYPRKGRKEVTLLITNKFPVLQEKTVWALNSLEDYGRTIPSLGIPIAFDTRVKPPLPRDPAMSYTGYGDVDQLWVIRDSTNGMPMIDALTLTRNSQFGYVYFDRWGLLNLKSELPSSVVATFYDEPDDDEQSYANIDIHYDSDATINSIKVREFQQVQTIEESTFERTDAIVETEQTLYNTESIKRFRRSEIEFKTFKKSSYPELESHILEKFAAPAPKASTVVVPIRSNAELQKMILIDIYNLVEIGYQDRLSNTYRVNRIAHYIVPGGTWRMEIGFDINHEGVYW